MLGLQKHFCIQCTSAPTTVTHYAIKIQSTETAILLTCNLIFYRCAEQHHFCNVIFFSKRTVFRKGLIFWACHIFCLFFQVPPFKRQSCMLACANTRRFQINLKVKLENEIASIYLASLGCNSSTEGGRNTQRKEISGDGHTVHTPCLEFGALPKVIVILQGLFDEAT